MDVVDDIIEVVNIYDGAGSRVPYGLHWSPALDHDNGRCEQLVLGWS